jgi:peptidyl-prolyl cis-trans isomerase A (cyclophilin A)
MGATAGARRAAFVHSPRIPLHTEHHLTIHAFSRFSRRSALVLAAALTFAATGHAQTAAPRVKLATSAGDIVVELDAAKAPKTVENFLQYVKDKHYDGTVFHRVIDGFMIQGGGFTADMQQKPTRAAIPLEAGNGLKNDKYTVAMARTGNPNSATSQFFINVKNNDSLNAPNPDGYGYAVFGKVVAGTDVVDKIRAVATGNKGGMQNVPLEAVTIKSATLLAK